MSRRVRSDNIALVPASMLPFRNIWQRLANRLPADEALLVVPEHDGALRRSMERIAAQLRRRGHRVAAIDASRVRPVAAAPPP